ncbi:GcrA family cell cycle regulator [Pseudochrobactrum sp. sp1633]|uniref:GcrA family cell cycle regulator n=1 Tax=Pseudochrobactrum sp. sp1633 TaxID=3036706 RepID=UPI0025A682F3|nr:GcrA family cell cycle regulator [Pseudochrobactrum sp. sp1633]MDM8346477.1 GcrA family cell cycle regulator [Pseudochrobactrum sp. sp1633]HWD12693.1 GcrA family cell cycle regulator [Pseudochrobactrum sp.]
MNWTDERVELLKKLWSEGLSASQIAAQLGGVSRNAVIGKVHRLKLSGRGKTTTAAPRSKKPAPAPVAAPRPATTSNVSSMSAASVSAAQAAPRATVMKSSGGAALQAEILADAVAAPIIRSNENVVVPISRHLTLLQLTERTCKWPVGDPLHDDFHFCGHESGESSPYCSYHSKLAFQPTAERRRAR